MDKKFLIKECFRALSNIPYSNRNKVFCVGFNKTGTTTIKATFRELGLKVGPQRPIEHFGYSFINGQYGFLIWYSKYMGNAFQDFPYSFPTTYKILDEYFPSSKFILTTRPEEDWYYSVLKDACFKVGNGRIPTSQQLQESRYVSKGWRWRKMKFKYDITENDPFNKDRLISIYRTHNDQVRQYFSNDKERFIEISVYNDNDYLRLAEFLGKKPMGTKFPWFNKSPSLKTR